MKSILNFNKKLIKDDCIDLTFVDYCEKIISTLEFPFTIDFIKDCEYNEDFCIDTADLVKYEVVDDESKIKDYLINHGYKENIDYQVDQENGEIVIDQRLFKLLLIDSKDSNKYIKGYLTLQDGYKNYRDQVLIIKEENKEKLLWKLEKIEIGIKHMKF